MREVISGLLLCAAALAPANPLAAAARAGARIRPSATRNLRQAAPGKATPPQEAVALPFRPHPDDELTREGFLHYYNMDYDGAIADFSAELKLHPDDPFAVNHLLAATLGKEMDREDALNPTLYTTDQFAKTKPEPINPQVKADIENLSARALALANAELAKNPNNADALFCRANARGYASVFDAVIQKHWLGALRSALGAYHDDERVLELNPNYSDAKMVVGMYQYIVGALSWYEKMLAFVVSIHGNKKKGLELVREAAQGGGEASIDAKTVLALFLAREKKYPEAIQWMHSVYADFPHNLIAGIGEAQLLQASGQTDAAIAAYRAIVARGLDGYFPGSHAERAALALGEALRKKGDLPGAAAAFDQVKQFPNPDKLIVAHAALEAGEIYDALGQRNEAVVRYNEVIRLAPGSDDADAAARFLAHPYRND